MKSNRYLLVVVVSFLSYFNEIYAQTTLVDSLKRALPIASGKDKWDILFELAYELYFVKPDTAFFYATAAYNYACELQDTASIVGAGRIRGQLMSLYSIGIKDVPSFVTPLYQIAVDQGYVEEVKKISNTLAITHTFLGNYADALYYNYESLAIRESEKCWDDMAASYNNIGLVYYKLENADKAILFFEKAIELRRKSDDRWELSRMHGNAALAYRQRSDCIMADRHLQLALLEYSNECDERRLTEIYYGMASSSFKQGKLDDARKLSYDSYQLACEQGDERLQLDNLLMLSEIRLMKDGDVFGAMDLARQAELLAIENGLKLGHQSTCSVLMVLHDRQRDLPKLAEYRKKWISIRSEVLKDELALKLAKIEVDYFERGRKATLDAQEKLLVVKEDLIDRQQMLIVLSYMVSALLLMLGIALYSISHARKRSALRLEEKIRQRTKDIEDIYSQVTKVRYARADIVYGKIFKIQRAFAMLVSSLDESPEAKHLTSDIRSNLTSIAKVMKHDLEEVHNRQQRI